MRRMRKIGVALYLIAAVVVTGLFTGSQFGPHTDRFNALLTVPWVRVLVFASACVVLIQMAVLLIAAIADRPEPAFLRLAGDARLEVALPALVSISRTAAERDDVLIEEVGAHVRGRDRSEAHIEIEAIALVDGDLAALGQEMQGSVQRACEQMLGVPGVSVRVRFLPSKTVTVTREVC